MKLLVKRNKVETENETEYLLFLNYVNTYKCIQLLLLLFNYSRIKILKD